jgi:hypothetical protein
VAGDPANGAICRALLPHSLHTLDHRHLGWIGDQADNVAARDLVVADRPAAAAEDAPCGQVALGVADALANPIARQGVTEPKNYQPPASLLGAASALGSGIGE